MLSETQWIVLVGVLALVATAVIAFVMARLSRRRYAELNRHHAELRDSFAPLAPEHGDRRGVEGRGGEARA